GKPPSARCASHRGFSEEAALSPTAAPLSTSPAARWKPRPSTTRQDASFLERIVERLPHASGTEEELEYLALLDRALLDRQLSEHEKDLLVDAAHAHGIDREACRRLHILYFDHVVANTLERPAFVDASPPSFSAFRLQRGDLVAFTGAHERNRDEWFEILRAHGLLPSSFV